MSKNGSKFYAEEAERAVLAAILNFNDGIFHVCDMLKPDRFYQDKNRIIYETAIELMMDNIRVDYVTVREKLESKDQYKKVGGADYLAEITSHLASTANVKHHANIINDRYALRQLYQAGRDIIKKCQSGSKPEAIANESANQIFQISQGQENRQPRVFAQMIEGLESRIEAYSKRDKDAVGVRTGFVDLDKRLGPMKPGQLCVLAGATSQGKTALAECIADNVTRNGDGVLFISLEMDMYELAERLVCINGKINSEHLHGDGLTTDEYQTVVDNFVKAGISLSGRPLIVNDNPDMTTADIYANILRYKQEQDIKLVVVDYLQLIEHGWGETQNLKVGKTTRELKKIAKAAQIPILLLSQLRRIGANKPSLDDLRESGSIEQDSDKVMFVYRPEFYDIAEYEDSQTGQTVSTENMAFVFVKKNRGGSTGTVKMTFLKEYTKFQDHTGREDNAF